MSGRVRTLETLLIVSHVMHYRHRGRLFAYGPYAREIEVWAELFPRVVIAGPGRRGPPPGDCLPLERANIALRPQRETGGESLKAKATQLLALPGLIWGLSRAMSRADAIQVRCPGNLGLLGALLAPLCSRYIVAKYAGQWGGYPGEPRTSRFQRALLKSRWWRGPVTVYSSRPGQPAHVIPFFTSMLTAEDLRRARRTASASRSIAGPPSVLWVGRLSGPKNVDVLLSAIARLAREGRALRCEIVGEGPRRELLEQFARDLGIRECVLFAGGVGFEQVLDRYEAADVLVLASDTEGWPKALAEAMAFGLICIGSNRGFPAEMLGQGRGLLVAPRDVNGLTDLLRQVTAAPERYAAMRARAAAWGQAYSLDGLREALRALLEAQWVVQLGPAQ